MAQSILWGAATGADVCQPWAGALSGSLRIIGEGGADDALALDWSRNPGTGCLGLWRMDEAAWNGTAGEVVDVMAASHGQANGGVTTIADGMNRAGTFGSDADSSKHVIVPWSTGYNATRFAWGGWVKWDGNGNRTLWGRNGKSATQWGQWIMVTAAGAAFHRTVTTNEFTVQTDPGTVPVNEWCYIAASYNGTTQDVYCYTAGGLYSQSANRTGNLRGGTSASYIGAYFTVANGGAAIMDEVAVWSSGQAQSVFDALAFRYPATGSGTIVDAGLTGYAVAQVDWAETGTSGGGGIVVELQSAPGVWQAVTSGVPLASPITLVDSSSVRVTLTPSTDAIASETPEVNWLRLIPGPSGYARPRISRITSGLLTGLIR